MPHYTVHIDSEPEELFLPYEYGKYSDLKSASAAVRAAELSYPKGAAWVEDEDGRVIPRDELHEAELDEFLDSIDNSYTPPALDEYQDDGLDPLMLAAENIRRECPHNWKLASDGLFHCRYACGVRPHKPHPGEMNDPD